MKWNVLIFSLLVPLITPLFGADRGTDTTKVSLSRYNRFNERRERVWETLMPDHAKLQFAGSIGMFSGGVGWTYGRKKQWETDILIGFLPKFESEKAKAVLTLKESYIPWKVRLKHSQWYLQPLSCSLFMSSVLSGEFWAREPDKYPNGYYGFSTRIRFNLSMGQRVAYVLKDPDNWWFNEVAAYYELGACDTDFITFFGDRTIRFYQILSLAIGMKLYY